MQLLNELPLLKMEVQIPSGAEASCQVNVISTTRSFTLSAKSTEIRDEWAVTLCSAINQFQSKQSSLKLHNTERMHQMNDALSQKVYH